MFDDTILQYSFKPIHFVDIPSNLIFMTKQKFKLNKHTKADSFNAKTTSQFTLYTFLCKFSFSVFLKDSLIVVSEIGQVVHTPAVRQLQNRSHLTPKQIRRGCSDVGAV